MHIPLGRIAFKEAWELQKDFFSLVASGMSGDVILTCEHPAVLTLGKQSKASHLLQSREDLKRDGIDVYEIDRGGDVTYHGFGQVVAYPIMNLTRWERDIHKFLRTLEDSVIQTMEDFGIRATRKSHPDPKKNYTGVWVSQNKLCAIGIRYSRFTTMHGLALNLSPDMSGFGRIVPCGIEDFGVTSMEEILGEAPKWDAVEARLVAHIADFFGRELIRNEQFLTYG